MSFAQSATLKTWNQLFKQTTSQGGQQALDTPSLSQLLSGKMNFMGAVFGTLIFQLAVTFFVMYALTSFKDEFYKKLNTAIFGIFIIQLLLVVLLATVPMPMPLKLVLFTLFSVLNGVILSYVAKYVPARYVKVAVLATIALFVTLFVVGALLVVMGVDLTWLWVLLMVALVGLIVYWILDIFLKFPNMYSRVITIVGILVFSLFIVVDTHFILRRDYQGDYVTAALDYYLDIINLFLNILRYVKQ
jgi:FtsH-binding integral membrane protein